MKKPLNMKETIVNYSGDKMEVCIVNTIERLKDGKGWQIMKRAGSGYNHVFPGALYTMEEAANICNENNFQVVAIGDFWECLKK